MTTFSKATIGTAAVWLAISCVEVSTLGQRWSPLRNSLVAAQTGTDAPAADRALVDKYCVRCHNDRLKTGQVTLEKLDLSQIGDHAEIWERVINKLRGGSMPPAGMPQPDKVLRDNFIASLEHRLDTYAAGHPHVGQPVVHRLNRIEYANAIRDLLGLDIDGESLLPADESGYGFDNIADVLSITPLVLERYLAAAQKISRLAVGDQSMPPEQATFKVPTTIVQLDRVSDELPFLSRGGLVVTHNFPVDGEYVLKLNLQKTTNRGIVQGLQRREQLDLRLDGARLQLFQVGGECVNSNEGKCAKASFQILTSSEYERTADDLLELRTTIKAGPHVVGAAFLKKNALKEGAGPERQPLTGEKTVESDPMTLESVKISGPYNPTGAGDTPSRRKIFTCEPVKLEAETACARQILSALGKRAYRRTLTDNDVERLLRFFRSGRQTGTFETGIRLAIERLLVSPNFLLRVDSATPTNRARLDTEVASRLSFFLWNSIPDDELLEAVARGRLSQPTVLENQVKRMLNDARASSLVTNFAAQWLYLRDLKKVRPDAVTFPEFDDSLRTAFERETELFLESQMRENRPVGELLTANYSFLNERLAEFYGVPNVYGTHFRRVTMTDPNRFGLLGQGSLLTVTSYSTRTSPVIRGRYVLANFLGAPPPPPPPDVPTLAEKGDKDKPTTIREKMEVHRQNAVCASCHARMDPIGFALENFNGIGKWRTAENGLAIDSTGTFLDGSKFSGPGEFRQLLTNHTDEFVRTFTEKMMTYALGRGIEFYDRPALRAVVRGAGPDYRWSSILLGIVRSPLFQGISESPFDKSGTKLVH